METPPNPHSPSLRSQTCSPEIKDISNANTGENWTPLTPVTSPRQFCATMSLPAASTDPRIVGSYGSTLTFPLPGPAERATINPFGEALTFEEADPDAFTAELVQQVYNWIEICLENHKQHGSFGIIVNARFRGIIKPCVLMGFPDPDNFRVPYELPEGISLWVEKNSMGAVGGNEDPAWREKVTTEKDEKVYLKAVSLGEKDDMNEGGSFGGWIIDQDDKVYGLTCKHCLPTAKTGSIVVSPSTLEVTSVFETNLQYSTLAPERLHFRKARNDLTHHLFNNYDHSYCQHGVEVEHTFGGSSVQKRRMLLSGSKVGTVVGGSFTHDTVFLQDHNEELRSQGKSQFVLPENLKPTALDWLIFQAEPSRIGGNFNMQARIAEHIRRIGYLAPGNHVFKFGRTTELTRGKVSAFVLFKWEFDETTHEIAVVGTQQLPFARKGDSGAAIMISSDPEDLMGGILIGADLYARLAVVTPFNILLQSISQTFNRQFKFADLADMEESEN